MQTLDAHFPATSWLSISMGSQESRPSRPWNWSCLNPGRRELAGVDICGPRAAAFLLAWEWPSIQVSTLEGRAATSFSLPLSTETQATCMNGWFLLLQGYLMWKLRGGWSSTSVAGSWVGDLMTAMS